MAGLLGPMMGQQMGVRLGLLGAPEEEQTPDPRFWQGGDKFTGRDGLAGLLAIIGDVAAQQSGNQGNAIEGLLGGRTKALDEFKKKAEQERKLQQTMALIQQAYPNLSPAQQHAMAAGVGDYADFKQPEAKGLQPVAGPTGVYVWDRDNYRFVPPTGGIPGGASGDDGWVDIDEEEAKRLQGGGTGNGVGGFPRRF